MYYTYVLLCRNFSREKLYVGSTSDLEERIRSHRNKSVPFTKEFDSISLIYYEASLNKSDARKRELQLKTGFGRGYIKRRLEEYFKEMRG